MKVRLLTVDAPEWQGLLGSTAHDVYHLPGYVAVAAEHEGAEPRALVVEDERGLAALFVPLLVREVAEGLRDVSSPYGYPGPLVTGVADEDFIRAAFTAAAETLAAQGIVSAFLRLHPFLSPDIPADTGVIVDHGPTVSIDLRGTPDERWHSTRRDHRAQIRKAIAGGLRARMDDWEHFDTFVALYRATMDRLDARPFYRFEGGYFPVLRSVLGDRLHLCTVEVDGSIAAAGLFTEEDGIIEYHLSGTDPEQVRWGPTKLMIHHVAEWAAERGNRLCHLGGGLGGSSDTLFEFKAGFSPDRHSFRTLRIVLDERAYRQLCSNGVPALDPDDRTGFFPAYRRS